MEIVAVITPIFATIVGILLSAMIGMVLSRVSAIERHLEKMNNKLFSHITDPLLHEAERVKVAEEIKVLMDRMTRAEEKD